MAFPHFPAHGLPLRGLAFTHTWRLILRGTPLDEWSVRHLPEKTQPLGDTNFRTQNTSKRAAADTRGWQLNNTVNYPLVLSATGVIQIMLNFTLSKLNLTTKPNVPGAEIGHTIPNSNDDDSNKINNSKSKYNNIKYAIK